MEFPGKKEATVNTWINEAQSYCSASSDAKKQFGFLLKEIPKDFSEHDVSFTFQK